MILHFYIVTFLLLIKNKQIQQNKNESLHFHLNKYKIYYLRLVNKPGVVPPLRFEPGAGGLFMTSLIRRQFSSSLSVFDSYKIYKHTINNK